MVADETFLLLKGRTAIVTGSSRGIGRGVALELARAGANVVINGRHEPAIDGVVKEIRELGREAIGIRADVSRKVEVDRMVERTMVEWGRIDILVNNASVGRDPKSIEQISDADFDEMIRTNLGGPLFCAQAVASRMIPQKIGVIINVSCISGRYKPGPTNALYVASRNGLCGMTRHLAKLLGPYNVRVNAILAGDTVEEPPDPVVSQRFEGLKREIYLGRFGVPRDQGLAVVMLASDYGRWITGESIAVCGGQVTG